MGQKLLQLDLVSAPKATCQLKLKQQAAERESLKVFEAALPDPRRKQGQRYPLESVVLISTMVSRGDDGESIQLWGEQHAQLFGTFLKLPYGAPGRCPAAS